jgi:excisionase family DNA binding protein
VTAGLAAHVAYALRNHRAACEATQVAVPVGFRELEQLAVAAAAGQSRPEAVAALAGALDGRDDRPMFFSTDQAARLLGRSPRTIRRRCGTGAIKAVRDGGDWRIPRAALDRLLEVPV